MITFIVTRLSKETREMIDIGKKTPVKSVSRKLERQKTIQEHEGRQLGKIGSPEKEKKTVARKKKGEPP